MRLVAELLSSDGRLVHQAALCHGERRHAPPVIANRCSVPLAAAGARGRTRRARLGVGGGGYRNDGSICAEFEVTAGEFLQRALVLEEDDLAVGLATELKANRNLRHRRVTDDLALSIHAAAAISAADHDAPLPDRREHRVPKGGVEELAAPPRVFEDADRVAIFVGPR